MTENTARKPRLLIVNDDQLITETLGFVLGDLFEIFVAHTRAEGIAVLRAMPALPEVALIDLGLPPAVHAADEGFALIADLLAHDARMRIVVLSGQNDESNARHARALGALDFIAKPAVPQLLRAALARALQTRGEPAASPEIAPGCRAHRTVHGDAEAAHADCAVRRIALSGTNRRRIGQREGCRRLVLPAPADEPPRPPFPGAQLCRHRPVAGRADAFRLCQGRVHRRPL